MDIYLVFNELSAQGEHQSQTEYEARTWMAEFAHVITASRKLGLKALKVKADFFETQLVKGYHIRAWLRDRNVDREQQRRIRSVGTALWPLPDDIAQAEAEQMAFEFKHQGHPAFGLGSAYLLESVAISLNTAPNWQLPTILLNIEEFDAESDSLISRQEPVRHVSQITHLTHHQTWLQDRFSTSVADGRYLLEKCTAWFPNLHFIENAQKQIEAMDRGTPQLRQVVIKLFELQNYCANWTEGGFDKEQLASKTSPESPTVRNNPTLRRQRTFLMPNNSEAFFEWHIRLTPNEWRLYFLPDPQKRIMYIGYIGQHLPTAKY